MRPTAAPTNRRLNSRERLDTESKEPMKPSSLDSRRSAAQALDRLRTRVGPIGIPVTELIRAGRKR